MYSAALRAVRPVVVRSTRRSTPSNAFRALSTTTPRFSGPAPPSLYGEGAKPGEIPSDEQQATGLERFQLLGEMNGVESFDLEPLDSSRVGTLEDPIKVFSLVCSASFQCSVGSYNSSILGHVSHCWMHWFASRKS
jgi:cytochrome c oxidase subunit 5b